MTLTDKPLAQKDRKFIEHEAEHMRQFNHYYKYTGFWLAFLVYYLAEP
ncbi:hypothetical protein OHA25_20055 [Nonomuraea sp. NBC_00507]